MSTAAIRSLQAEEAIILNEIASLDGRDDAGALLRLVALRSEHLIVREAIENLERDIETGWRGTRGRRL